MATTRLSHPSNTLPISGETHTAESIEFEFQRPSSDILVVPRSIDPYEVQVSKLQFGDVRDNVKLKDAATEVPRLASQIGLVDPLILNDVLASLNLFATVFKRSTLELRLEHTQKQSCPKFHCDNVFARLIINYFGPTTEYIYLDRPNAVHSAPHFAWVLLKGGKHPTFQHSVHHRSPEMNGEVSRLCAIINFADWVGKKS